MAALFLVDPRNRAFAEGRTPHPDRRVDWPGGLFLALVMDPFLWLGLDQVRTTAASAAIRVHLAGDGRPGTAIVRERREIPHDEGAPTYVLAFDFAPPGDPAARTRADRHGRLASPAPPDVQGVVPGGHPPKPTSSVGQPSAARWARRSSGLPA